MKPYGEDLVYSQVKDMSSNMDEEIMRRLDEEMRKKFGGATLDEYIEQLKQQRNYTDEETRGK